MYVPGGGGPREMGYDEELYSFSLKEIVSFLPTLFVIDNLHNTDSRKES